MCTASDPVTLPACTCTDAVFRVSAAVCARTTCPPSSFIQAATSLAHLCDGYPIQTQTRPLVVNSIVCLVLATTFVILRYLSRWVVLRQVWWDDWATLIATISLIAMIGGNFAAIDLGFGRHFWDISPLNGVAIAKLFYAGQLLYIVIQVTSKVAILLFFWRIFDVRWLRITVMWSIAFLVIHGVIFMGIAVFQCTPIADAWEKGGEGKCLDIATVGVVGAGFSIAEDVFLWVLPFFEVRKMTFDFKKKLVICIMFSIGSFACIASMIRLRYIAYSAHSRDSSCMFCVRGEACHQLTGRR